MVERDYYVSLNGLRPRPPLVRAVLHIVDLIQKDQYDEVDRLFQGGEFKADKLDYSLQQKTLKGLLAAHKISLQLDTTNPGLDESEDERLDSIKVDSKDQKDIAFWYEKTVKVNKLSDPDYGGNRTANIFLGEAPQNPCLRRLLSLACLEEIVHSTQNAHHILFEFDKVIPSTALPDQQKPSVHDVKYYHKDHLHELDVYLFFCTQGLLECEVCHAVYLEPYVIRSEYAKTRTVTPSAKWLSDQSSKAKELDVGDIVLRCDAKK